MGKSVQIHMKSVRARQQWLRSLQVAAWGWLVGSLAGLVLASIKYAAVPGLDARWPFAAAGIGLVLGFIAGQAWRLKWRETASAIDARYGLKDRAATALEIDAQPQRSTVHELAYDDALNHLRQVRPHDVAPLRMPRVLPYACATFAATLALVLVATWNTPVTAEPPEALAVVVAQSERVTSELEELEQFVQEHPDPELEKLLKELKETAEQMKQPGTDLREALAKLSEMQAALQAEQAKQNAGSVDAELQAVGEALALAQPLADAGQALASGQMEKAAQELEKLEVPELDRQTEKAVKEKLEQAAQRSSNDGQNSLSQAVSEMSQGLGGDAKKFSEGSQKLAGEARKQGQRKKLSDLLQKQCNCLGECKSECEGECQSQAKGKNAKPGGKKAGLAGSDGELGDRTPLLGNKKMEKITGKQSETGEVEVETTHSPEGNQDAQREYRQKYTKYKEISEEVLDSEPIPLGHRQTIRRYFESIRPSNAETDKMDQAAP